MELISADNDTGLTDLETRERSTETILTVEQRRTAYRQKLKVHQEGRGYRLKQFAQKRREYFRGLDLIPRRKRAEDIDNACRYFNGDQYGSYNELGMFEDRRRDGDFAYTLPMLSGHVEQAFIQLLKVRPGYEFDADDKNDNIKRLVSKLCEEVGTKDLIRVMNPRIQDELYNLLIAGESTRIVGWEPNPVSPKMVKRPKYEKQTVDLAGRRECAQCKAILQEGDESCPKCGSTEINSVAGGQTQKNVMTGLQDVALGENTLNVPHILAMQRDMSAVAPEDSSFVIEYSYLDKHVAEWMYQSEIEPSTLPLPIEMLLRYDLERSSTQIDAIIGSSRLALPSREGSFGTVATAHLAPNRKQPQERHFWEPSEYGQFVCQVDEQLPDGRVIPAGTVLGDYFPRGAFWLFVGDTLMDIKECIRRRKLTILRYGRIAGTNLGAGLARKIMPLQDAGNDDFNLNQTIKHTVGHPFTVINGHFVDNLPGAGNVLKLNKPGLDDIGKVAKQFPGQAVNNADGTQQLIQSAMQFIGGTNTVGSGVAGAPDMRAAGTATGIAAMQEQAAARQSGPVDQRIAADKETLMQLLENIQEYSTPEQKAELAKQYGPDVVKAFFAMNLRQTMTINIKPNSDMPRSMALTQANYIAFGQAAAAILPQAGSFPWVMEFLSELADTMGFPLSVGQGRNDRREAEYRLNCLIEIEADLRKSNPAIAQNAVLFAAAMHEKLAQMCAPLIAMDDQGDDPSQAPEETDAPRVLMQDHDAFQDVYKDALFSEQAKGWSDARRLTVIQLFLDHYKAKMMKSLVDADLMAAVQAKLAPPAPPSGPSLEEQDAMAQQEHVREANMQAAAHESDRQTKDEDVQRKMVLAQHETENKIALERAKFQMQQELGGPPDSRAKLIETMAYKDAPEDIRRQMEIDAGYEPSAEGSETDNKAATEAGHTVLEHHLDQAGKDADLERQKEFESHKAKVAPKPVPAKAK